LDGKKQPFYHIVIHFGGVLPEVKAGEKLGRIQLPVAGPGGENVAVMVGKVTVPAGKQRLCLRRRVLQNMKNLQNDLVGGPAHRGAGTLEIAAEGFQVDHKKTSLAIQ
jgi:hypothetical protein